jgi:hypothetical protein
MLLLFFLNFAISWFNAWSIGSTWDGAKARGGAPYFMNWMGAIMSASGFSWCYLILLSLLGAVLPMSLFVDSDPPATGPLLDAASLEAVGNLGYAVLILPILGSGLGITVQTWRDFARNKARGVADYALTGWNTYAQVSNMWSAANHLPGVLDSLGEFFFSSKSDDSKSRLVLMLVALAVGAGMLTTYSIVQQRRRTVLEEEIPLQ